MPNWDDGYAEKDDEYVGEYNPPMDDSPQGKAIAALGQATANTHRCIAQMAAARNELQQVRQNRLAAPESVSDAATRYRQLEAELGGLIEAEMAAHITMLDAVLEGGENADSDTMEQPADSSGRSG